MHKRIFEIILVILTFVSTGCVSVKLIRTVYTADKYTTDATTVRAMKEKNAHYVRLSVPDVKPADPNAPVNKIPIRSGMVLVSPSGSFAKYMQDALIKDLTASDLYSATASDSIQMTILKNRVDAPAFSTGTETLVLRMKLIKRHRVMLDKSYSATVTFETHVSGAASARSAIATYPKLIHALFTRIYSDKNFLRAIGRIHSRS